MSSSVSNSMRVIFMLQPVFRQSLFEGELMVLRPPRTARLALDHLQTIRNYPGTTLAPAPKFR
jgi:hypothetical protein